MFWRVLNKTEQKKELIGFFVFIKMETILSNLMRKWQSFTKCLVLHIVMWRNCDSKEPFTPGKDKQQQQNYFLKMSPSLTKPGHCVLFRRVKCPYFHKYRPCPMRLNFICCFLSPFLQVIKQKVVGRRFLMATWSVNICHFRVHDFSLNHSTRRHFRRRWESSNCIARRE